MGGNGRDADGSTNATRWHAWEPGEGERVYLKMDTRKKQKSEFAFIIWWSVGKVSEPEASNREHRS